jgi:predicted nucleotidyltransferase
MNPFLKLFSSPSFAAVLSIFLSRPNEQFYQSYIIESTGCAMMQVQRALKRLEESGFISKIKSGNRTYYIANPLHPAFEDIKRAFFKTVLFGDVLKEALKFQSDNIKYCFIYGSLASGNESYNSDVDLFIIGDLGLREVASILNSVGTHIGREINPTVYSEKEFKKKIKEENPFIQEVMNKPKIWLIGDQNEFTKMAK